MTDFDFGEAVDTPAADSGEMFTDEALDAADQADAELEALDEIGDFIVDNWNEIADGEVSTESLWEDFNEQFGEGDAPADVESPYEPEAPAEPDVSDEPQPGDLDWEPSDTGVHYPDPERIEGNVGGPESLG